MGRRILLAVLSLFATAAVATAQTGGRIAGKVTAVEGRPLLGINISVSGMNRSAVSDTGGRFVIANVPAGPHTVQARGIGFGSSTTTVSVVDRQTASVTFALTAAATELTPMVVTGYGDQERRVVTGAFSTVTSEQLQDIPTSDPLKALQGHVAGVDIVASTNEPGAAMNVRIRGVRSLTASNEPLYVVDGVPLGGSLQDFNPAIIESIDVLKDAAATAIYGSRGANGVILVTTKKGGLDGIHTQFTADMYYGDQQPVRLVQMMNLQQYVKYMQDGAAAVGQDTSIAHIFSTKQQLAIKNDITTDWQKAVLRTGLQRSLQGGANGGSG